MYERSTLSTNTLLSLKLNLLQVFLLNQIIIDEHKFCSTVKQWSTHVILTQVKQYLQLHTEKFSE